MALNIRNPEPEKLAEALAKLTGETRTEAVAQALRERLARLCRERSRKRLADELDEIALHCSALSLGGPQEETLGRESPEGRVAQADFFSRN